MTPAIQVNKSAVDEKVSVVLLQQATGGPASTTVAAAAAGTGGRSCEISQAEAGPAGSVGTQQLTTSAAADTASAFHLAAQCIGGAGAAEEADSSGSSSSRA